MKKQTKQFIVVALLLLLTGMAIVLALSYSAMVEDCKTRYLAGENVQLSEYCTGHIPEQQA